MYIKYHHIERLGTSETRGILDGVVYIFPKIDGTNGTIWKENGRLEFGSRNRHLVDDLDNSKFKQTLLQDPNFDLLFHRKPTWHLFGEWLVPHTIKTYRESAWKKFYVFDVYDDGKLIHYDIYSKVLQECGIEFIPPLLVINRPFEDDLYKMLNKNFYLMDDGSGPGEGIVIKNYDYKNKYGKQIWAKIVRQEFKEKNAKEFGCGTVQSRCLVEERIVNEYVTGSLLEKTYAKIIHSQEPNADSGEWTNKYIPRLLNTVYYELIQEECWHFLKKFKNPTIDFRLLRKLCETKTKKHFAGKLF